MATTLASTCTWPVLDDFCRATSAAAFLTALFDDAAEHEDEEENSPCGCTWQDERAESCLVRTVLGIHLMFLALT